MKQDNGKQRLFEMMEKLNNDFHGQEEKDYNYYIMKDKVDDEYIEWLSGEFSLQPETIRSVAEISGYDPEETYNVLNNEVDRKGYGFDSITENNIKTIDKPIIPDAINVISQNPNAIKFTDKASFDEFGKQQKYFSASYSHCFYSSEEQEEWSRNGGQYTDPDSESSVLLFNTGHELVQVWDNKNSIGYIIPNNKNSEYETR